MRQKLRTEQDKYETVIQKNTFYLINREVEEDYEGYVSSLKNTLLVLRNDVETKGLTRELIEEFLLTKEFGLRSILALTGLSNENLKRLITLIRIINTDELNNLVYKKQWFDNPVLEQEELSEWGDKKIESLIKKNKFFRKGIVNLFFSGSGNPTIIRAFPLFETKKLTLEKLQFKVDELIDTIIRYKEKGSYSGKADHNAEIIIQRALEELEISYSTGDLIKFRINTLKDIKYIFLQSY